MARTTPDVGCRAVAYIDREGYAVPAYSPPDTGRELPARTDVGAVVVGFSRRPGHRSRLPSVLADVNEPRTYHRLGGGRKSSRIKADAPTTALPSPEEPPSRPFRAFWRPFGGVRGRGIACNARNRPPEG